MIIRSVAASRFHGLILPNKGCAKLDALVIKASAGTLFRARIIRCDTLVDALKAAKENGFDIAILDAHSPSTLHQFHPVRPTIYVLGNESGGVSDEVRNLASHQLAIPMANQVESLNVAVTAGIVAFAPNLFSTTKTGLE